MPITAAPNGGECKAVRIAADEKTKKHVENPAITIDARLTVLSAGSGSLIFGVKGVRRAVDGSLTARIFFV